MDSPAPQHATPPVYGCAFHPDRGTYIGCHRCGRPICTECMVPAPVGFHCPACVAEAQAQIQPALARAQRAQATAGFRAAPVTFTLIGINVAVWLLLTLTGGTNSRLMNYLALQATASCGIGTDVYVDATPAPCAASAGIYYPGISEGGYWQLLTSAFTHVALMHIAFNMLALWFLGPQLERFFGGVRYLGLYLLSALAGSTAVYWLADPAASTVGASGAVFGLMGALLIVAWRQRGNYQNILMWLGINVAFTFLGGPGISWQGHLGGLVGGSIVAAILMSKPMRAGRPPWPVFVATAAVLIGLVVARTLTLL